MWLVVVLRIVVTFCIDVVRYTWLWAPRMIYRRLRVKGGIIYLLCWLVIVGLLVWLASRPDTTAPGGGPGVKFSLLDTIGRLAGVAVVVGGALNIAAAEILCSTGWLIERGGASTGSGERMERVSRRVHGKDRPLACPTCGALNPSETLFCGECGAPLEGTGTPQALA